MELQPSEMAVPVAVDAPEFSPFAALGRLMRGRWLLLGLGVVVLSPLLGAVGFMNGTRIYDAQAILRVYPQQSNILYNTGDDSVIKTFDAFVKAETTYVASTPVMARATETLRAEFPELAGRMTVDDLTGSIEVKRNEALIVLTTKSKDPDFVAAKLQAVVDAYISLTAETAATLTGVRLQELKAREVDLIARSDDINRRTLAVGGEYGSDSLIKAHNEKVSQIDALMARQGEVAATLDALSRNTGDSSADMSNQEIMRATLLDRALADLNFDRAKREAELVTMLQRYNENSPQVRDKRGEIEIIDRSMAERREQIKVLGQTGALTDTSAASPEQSIAEIAALLEKVTQQLTTTREEARELNEKRVELGFLDEDRTEVKRLLDETRNALEVLQLESGKAMPGLTVLMSPPTVPTEPSDDSSKMLGAAGVAGGGVLALLAVLLMAMTNDRLRYSDDLWRSANAVPVLRVIDKSTMRDPVALQHEINRLRNALKLLPIRTASIAGRGKIIAVARLDKGAPDAVAQALADSFSRARMRTLLIDADQTGSRLSRGLGASSLAGWHEALMGQTVAPQSGAGLTSADFLPVGGEGLLDDSSVGIAGVRQALADLARDYDVVVVNAGSLQDSLSAELIVSAADFALGHVSVGDSGVRVKARIGSLDSLPRNGGAVVVTGARKNDPGLQV